ncbi:hypothetical protein BCR33DRAFT_848462 [Rhizoclosmatium globosum]|uniref:RRM domain-containing protein n=1 Tax=Rhizoclosmatium globosum TaxID=329046 RepID=A0A1Y2CL53_9FUNG|nr:hypothetical protein BCR33DRAFT_848462 [Rhizoclosmatium globosum]|eukprot:ORY47752.1 hypothetical protein BCR33DRAFT_848462 [Rhizoclosmatium globosum]
MLRPSPNPNPPVPPTSSTLTLLFQSRSNAPPSTKRAVLCVANVASEFSEGDIYKLFSPQISRHERPFFAHGIHVPIDLDSGSSLGCCFVEFESYLDALNALETTSKLILHGNLVCVRWSSQQELLSSLFPDLKAPPLDASPPSVPATKPRDLIFLTRQNINSLLLLCREANTRFAGKSVEKPFRWVISVLTKVPWHMTESISTIHRDHLFEMLKLSLDYAKTLLQDPHSQLDPDIVSQLIRCALCVPGFTEKQKVAVLNASDSTCPPDLEKFVFLESTMTSAPSTPITPYASRPRMYQPGGKSKFGAYKPFQYQKAIPGYKKSFYKASSSDSSLSPFAPTHSSLAAQSKPSSSSSAFFKNG